MGFSRRTTQETAGRARRFNSHDRMGAAPGGKRKPGALARVATRKVPGFSRSGRRWTLSGARRYGRGKGYLLKILSIFWPRVSAVKGLTM